jgi:hypothetical protein
MIYWGIESAIRRPIEEFLRHNEWVNLSITRKHGSFLGFTFSVITGNGVYGLLAKGTALADIELRYGVAFDSSEYSKSPVSVFQAWEQQLVPMAANRIHNYYSGEGMFVSDESNDVAFLNGLIASETSFSHFFKLPVVHETFCRIAAGCATDDLYDDICALLLGSGNYTEGSNRYRAMFRLWGRNRTDDWNATE